MALYKKRISSLEIAAEGMDEAIEMAKTVLEDKAPLRKARQLPDAIAPKDRRPTKQTGGVIESLPVGRWVRITAGDRVIVVRLSKDGKSIEIEGSNKAGLSNVVPFVRIELP